MLPTIKHAAVLTITSPLKLQAVVMGVFAKEQDSVRFTTAE